MANRRLTYQVDGHEFKLRPTSRKAMAELSEYSEGIVSKLETLREILQRRVDGEDISDEDIPTIPDEFDMAFEMFCIVTEGPHDKLDPDDFDVHIAKEALENFIPTKSGLM